MLGAFVLSITFVVGVALGILFAGLKRLLERND